MAKCAWCGREKALFEEFTEYGYCNDCNALLRARIINKMDVVSTALEMCKENSPLDAPYLVSDIVYRIDYAMPVLDELEQLSRKVPFFRIFADDYRRALEIYRAKCLRAEPSLANPVPETKAEAMAVVPRWLKQTKDCISLLQTTNNLKEFFEKYDFLIDRLERLSKTEHLFTTGGKPPHVMLEEVLHDREAIIRKFIHRYYLVTKVQIDSAKSEAEKMQIIRRFYIDLRVYENKMAPVNMQEIANVYDGLKRMYEPSSLAEAAVRQAAARPKKAPRKENRNVEIAATILAILTGSEDGNPNCEEAANDYIREAGSKEASLLKAVELCGDPEDSRGLYVVSSCYCQAGSKYRNDALDALKKYAESGVWVRDDAVGMTRFEMLLTPEQQELARVYDAMAKCCEALGNSEDAYACYEKMHEVDPTSAAAVTGMAKAKYKAGDLDSAVEILKAEQESPYYQDREHTDEEGNPVVEVGSHESVNSLLRNYESRRARSQPARQRMAPPPSRPPRSRPPLPPRRGPVPR